MCPLGMWRPLVAYMRSHLEHCFLVLGAIYFWRCVSGAMHCQLYCAGLLLQWRIYFIYLTFCWGIFTKHCTFENGRCPICLTGHIGGGYISIRCIYSDLCSYFIGGCINSRHTGHSSWSLTKIYCITNTQTYWVKNVKKRETVITNTCIGKKGILRSCWTMYNVQWTGWTMSNGQGHWPLSNGHNGLKTYLTSCGNSASSGFFWASGSIAKCSWRALSTFKD